MKRLSLVVGWSLALLAFAAPVPVRADSYALAGAEAAGFQMPADMALVKTLALPAYSLVLERYQQRRGAAAVLGGQLSVFKDASGAIVMVIGSHHPTILARNVARLAHGEARAVVQRDLGRAGDQRSDLLIDPATGRHFFRVETRNGHERWFHWIDAEDGTLLRKYDGRQTDHGTGVKGDTKSLLGGDGQAGTADDLTIFHNAAGHGFPGPHWDLISKDGRQSTLDARNGTLLAYTAADDDNNWTLVTPDRASPGQPALVDAQYYARVADEYYRGRHSLDWIAGCGFSGRSIAHYDSDYVNAFWDGAEVVYGDGDGFIAREFAGALDIVAHEHTHGVTQCTSNLVYQDESGALNESFSDMMGTSAEYYAAGRGLDPAAPPDWTIGEDAYLLSPDGFRNMADPAENFDPDHYSERQVGGDDNGGVHTNSLISSHAYYLVVNGGRNAGEAEGHPHTGPLVTGIGLAAAEQIFFLGFTSLAETATMCDARAATEAAAASLHGASSQERLSTTDAWLAVGLTDTVCNGAPPEAPTGLSATPVASSRVNLAWTDNSSSEDGFKVERSTDGVSFAQIASVPANTTSYADTGLLASTAYTYRVRAFTGTLYSDYSNAAKATTGPPPLAPTSLIATAVSSGRINLGWADNATNEAGFRIERSTAGGPFVLIATVAANVKSYANTGLTGSTKYDYRVRAYDGPNNSAYSNVATATTLAPPAAPTNLSATPASSSRIDLHWTDNATNETGYRVERSADGVSFALVTTLGANATAYSNLNLTASTRYYYRVASTDGATNSFSAVVSAVTLAPPPAPTLLAGTAVASSRIDLSWSDNASYEQGYRIERSFDGITYTQIGQVGPGVTAFSSTSLGASTLYRYRVRAYDGPNVSGYSNVASATTLPPPAAPSALVATTFDATRIDLAWADNSNYEQGYRVERSTDGVSYSQIAQLGANTTSYANLSLPASTTYHYRVRAYDGPNVSAYSNVASATTQNPPASPTGLTATAFSPSRIDLAWTDNATNETGYKVERSTDGITFTQFVTLAANATSYSNTGLTAATRFSYRVRANDGTVNSGYSNVASATTFPPPSAPTGLTATAISPSRIDLHWTDNASNETGYKVERSSDGVTFTQLVTLAANASSYSNTSLTASTSYQYRVRAYEGTANNSTYSNVASATTLPPPAAPTGLSATAILSSRIDLHWTDNGTNETGYKVERSTDGVNFVALVTLSANATSYSNLSLPATTTYYYRVRAYEGTLNNSGYSNVGSATTLPPPAAPTALVATVVSSSRIDLHWTDNATIEAGFKLERATNGGSFTLIATVGTNVTSYANISLVAGTSYQYRVRAYDGPNNSAYSNTVTANTP
jgi:Zn-dependent metalloprotease